MHRLLPLLIVAAVALPGCSESPVTADEAPSSSSSSSAASTAPASSSTSSSATLPPQQGEANATSSSTSSSASASESETQSETSSTSSSSSSSTAPPSSSSSTSSSPASSSSASSSSASSSSSSSTSSSSSSTTTSSAPPAGYRRIPAQTPSTRSWGGFAGKDIRPGVEVNTPSGGCTGNFIFHLNDQRYFIGTAAHCFDGRSTGGTYPTCSQVQSLPLGTQASIQAVDGSTYPGTLAYSSWHAMDAANEADADVCWNDFALVEIRAQDLAQVHPAVIYYGGPTRAPASVSALDAGDLLYATLSTDAYGAYVIEQPPRAAEGEFVEFLNLGWRIDSEWGIAGGSQGDSGGGLMGPDGEAWGSLSTGVQTGQFVYSNLWFALAYMEAKAGWAPSLVTWGEFDPAGDLD